MRGLVCAYAALALSLAAQEAPGGARVIGEVTAIDAATRQITVKADGNGPVSVAPGEKTLYLRVPPGEKDLKKATRIDFADIGPGDRVLARGALAADGKSLAATAVIVMTKRDLAAKHAADAAEWQRRGAAGIITEVNPETHALTLAAGPRTLLVETSDSTRYRRYAPDSVRFADARPSSLSELKAGDQVRVLGVHAPEDGRIQAEEIVSGSFRNVAALVKNVNPSANEIQITDLETKKPLVIRVNPDSTLRRLPPMMTARLAQRRQDGAPPNRPAAGARWGDFNQMLERMPALSLGELKPGDAIIVSSTAGADPSRLTAIVLLAGVEPLLASAPQGGPALGGWSFEIPLP